MPNEPKPPNADDTPMGKILVTVASFFMGGYAVLHFSEGHGLDGLFWAGAAFVTYVIGSRIATAFAAMAEGEEPTWGARPPRFFMILGALVSGFAGMLIAGMLGFEGIWPLGGVILGAAAFGIATDRIWPTRPSAPATNAAPAAPHVASTNSPPPGDAYFAFDAARFGNTAPPPPPQAKSKFVDLINRYQVDIYSDEQAARFADALHGDVEPELERDINHPACPPDLRRFFQNVLDHYRRKHGRGKIGHEKHRKIENGRGR